MRAHKLLVCVAVFLFNLHGVSAQHRIISPASSMTVLEYKVIELERKADEAEANIRVQGKEIIEYEALFKTSLWLCGGLAAILASVFGYMQIRGNKLQAEILSKGEETISLVNGILALARDSTKSAMKMAEERAKRELEVLDQAVNKLMMFSNRDTRDVVIKSESNDELRDLFHELTAFEFVNRTLDECLPLRPACRFLKGLKCLEDQRFKKAIESWRETYNDASASAGVKIRSQYWIGHLQISLGRFAEAEESFAAAVGCAKAANVSDDRRLELERLCIETKLFGMNGEEAAKLIKKIDDLVQECESKHHVDARLAALRTKGNILYTVAMGAHSSGDRTKAADSMRKAKALWREVKEGGQEVNMAARREYAFACYALEEDLAEAEQLLKQTVRDEARKQYTNCFGHREKAYYAMIQLMVAMAQKDESRAQSMGTRANFHVAETHDLEFSFSPLRKRPISRHDFQDDIKWVRENGLPKVV